jgi:hypothetical protein
LITIKVPVDFICPAGHIIPKGYSSKKNVGTTQYTYYLMWGNARPALKKRVGKRRVKDKHIL